MMELTEVGVHSRMNSAREILAMLAKEDIKSAYCIVMVHSDDHPLLDICEMENLFIDCAHPFGLSLAPRIFSAIPDSIYLALFIL